MENKVVLPVVGFKPCKYCGGDAEVTSAAESTGYRYEVRCPHCSDEYVGDYKDVVADFDMLSNNLEHLRQAWNGVNDED